MRCITRKSHSRFLIQRYVDQFGELQLTHSNVCNLGFSMLRTIAELTVFGNRSELQDVVYLGK